VNIFNNLMENSWPEGQVGWAVIFNSFRDGGWEVVEDVQFTGNTIRNTTNGVNLRGVDTDEVLRMRRILITDNLFENMGAFGEEGKPFQLLQGTESVVIDHNTVRGRVTNALTLDSLAGFNHASLRFTNNLLPHGMNGVFSNGGKLATAALDERASGYTFAGNALYARPEWWMVPYPAGNFFPASEAESLALVGTDAVKVGIRSVTPQPSQTPTPLPPTMRKVAWPKGESEQDKVVAAQWAEGYRFKRNLSGAYVEFEKVK
jgi:hypothetical protein